MTFALNPAPVIENRWTASPSSVLPKTSPSIAPHVMLDAQPADAHIFGIEIVLDALMSTLLAKTGLLDTAERRLDRGDEAFIHADHTVFQPFHDTEGAAEIAGVEIGGEAEL